MKERKKERKNTDLTPNTPLLITFEYDGRRERLGSEPFIRIKSELRFMVVLW